MEENPNRRTALKRLLGVAGSSVGFGIGFTYGVYKAIDKISQETHARLTLPEAVLTPEMETKYKSFVDSYNKILTAREATLSELSKKIKPPNLLPLIEHFTNIQSATLELTKQIRSEIKTKQPNQPGYNLNIALWLQRFLGQLQLDYTTNQKLIDTLEQAYRENMNVS